MSPLRFLNWVLRFYGQDFSRILDAYTKFAAKGVTFHPAVERYLSVVEDWLVLNNPTLNLSDAVVDEHGQLQQPTGVEYEEW